MTAAMRAVPVEVRVWRFIDKRGPDDCWPWTGATNRRKGDTTKAPYGNVKATAPNKNSLRPHRVVYEDQVGPIPDGLTIDHTCKNTLCCNPLHLEPVTLQVNNERSDNVGVRNARKTHCPRGHEYSVENTGYRKGTTFRYCRTCFRLYQRAKNAHGYTWSEWLASLTQEGPPPAKGAEALD